ncbi:MAG: multifunctional CCA tRNA nucleotidyl transferase/2'3'-cyclic phosphodiesterase/2'nucleotidase/phosphatase, partial [Gammaproteobacteria bacterium]|nr:multifunctional CCA tRNA nucleotidyl transferase/2'3'-cyclic phosphodiesterase/2'nucleotidase/phosphatase [Gammaproteobacteria bacterium]
MTDELQIYLVGGALRDELLGLPVHEKDWVVTGATPQRMLELGYQQVGKNFPVFLHPDSKEEYALARTERKTGSGHTGFSIDANPQVTLEQDLSRRDLTINAIARSAAGQLVDPYGGINDLKQRVLKHVSNAFVEDPLRVLRVARFHARLAHLNFQVDPATLEVMRTISRSGELATLPGERIWREIAKALATPSPQVFFATLYRCDALEQLMPELAQRWHQVDNMRGVEPGIGARTQAALAWAARENLDGEVRWAVCCHALGNAAQPLNIGSSQINRNAQATQNVQQLCARLHAPNNYARLAELAARHSQLLLNAASARPDTIVQLLDACDAWRRPQQFEQLLQLGQCLLATSAEPQAGASASLMLLRQALHSAQ